MEHQTAADVASNGERLGSLFSREPRRGRRCACDPEGLPVAISDTARSRPADQVCVPDYQPGHADHESGK